MPAGALADQSTNTHEQAMEAYTAPVGHHRQDLLLWVEEDHRGRK